MRIGFSTLGCPGWTLEYACAQAAALGYDGIELRLLDGQLVTAHPAEAERTRVRDVLAGSGLDVSALASSVSLAGPDADATLAELQAMVVLATHWEIPAVRVFGGRVPSGEPRAGTVRRAADVVTAALPDAARHGVRIVLETHDDFSAARHAAAILAAVPDPAFGAIWDLQHTWLAGEQPGEVWAAIGDRVVEIQVKDGRPDGNDGNETGHGWRQTQLGDGVVPVRDCLAVAVEAGFDGWLVVEWEKHWSPDLAEPEIAFPAHRTAIGDHLASLGR